MNPEYHEIKAIAQAITFIGYAKADNGNQSACHRTTVLNDAALRLQFIMDCSKSSDARYLAATIVDAFDLMPRIEALRAEAAA